MGRAYIITDCGGGHHDSKVREEEGAGDADLPQRVRDFLKGVLFCFLENLQDFQICFTFALICLNFELIRNALMFINISETLADL